MRADGGPQIEHLIARLLATPLLRLSLGRRVPDPTCPIPPTKYASRVQGSGFRVQVSGFRVQG